MSNGWLLDKLNVIWCQRVYRLDSLFWRPACIGIDANDSVCNITDGFDNVKIMLCTNFDFEYGIIFRYKCLSRHLYRRINTDGKRSMRRVFRIESKQLIKGYSKRFSYEI